MTPLSPFPPLIRLVGCLLLFVPVVSSTGDAAAQSSDASAGIITGTAAGPNGEIYGGVKVSLTTPGNGPVLSQTTGEDGQFRFTHVPAGSFRVTLTCSGFDERTVTGELQTGQVYDVHSVVLTLARTTSNVVVSEQQQDIAQEQIRVELKQRILGVLPNFYVSYDQRFVPLTARQKLYLAMRANIDPVTFAGAGVVAGIEQANDTFPAYGAGGSGYATRFAQAYGDGFISNTVGNGLLAAAFKQDPRYFWKGNGSVASRIWYATYTSVMCKGDNGHWEVAYAAILGGMAAGGISDLYYPSQNRNGTSVIFGGAAIGIGTGVLQNLAQEFLIKHITPHAGKSSPQP
jgi:hypothetical protein